MARWRARDGVRFAVMRCERTRRRAMTVIASWSTEWPTDAWLRLPLVAFASAHAGAVRDDETDETRDE